jgi:hypothetical protein
MIQVIEELSTVMVCYCLLGYEIGAHWLEYVNYIQNYLICFLISRQNCKRE